MARLVSYPWPGNVRELANTLERELIVSRGRDLEVLRTSRSKAGMLSPGLKRQQQPSARRRAIQKALEAAGGKIYGKQGAAARLGIPPSTLQGKMRRLKMKRRSLDG